MLNLYIKSVIIYFIIYWALKKISKTIMFNRKDVNYNNYKGNGKGMYYIFCFIPLLRLFIIGVVFFITFAQKETLDKFFKKKLEDK